MSVVSDSELSLSPSMIHGLNPRCSNMMSSMTEQYSSNDSVTIPPNGDRPRLQVVEKSGCWFALNNTQLELYRDLEKRGLCAHVLVDVVPWSHVPRDVQGMMEISHGVTDHEANITATNDQPTKRFVPSNPRVLDNNPTNGVCPTFETDDSGSESSDYTDSDSEFDWSQDEPGSSDVSNSDSESELSADNRETHL